MYMIGYGHRRWRSRAVIHNQCGDNGRGRERQQSGNAQKSVPVQNTRDTARTGAAVDPGEQRYSRGDGRGRRATRQKTVDDFRPQRHCGTCFVQGTCPILNCIT